MTALGKATGTADAGLVAALDQGGNPLTYVFTQIFAKENISGAAVIAVIYGACLLYTVIGIRRKTHAAVKSENSQVQPEIG